MSVSPPVRGLVPRVPITRSSRLDCRVRDSRAKVKRGGGRSFNRDLRGPDEDDNPFSLDNPNNANEGSSSDDDDDGDSDDSDGFGGKISKSSTKTAQDEARETEELSKSLGGASIGDDKPSNAPSTAPGTGTKAPTTTTGGRGLGERKGVKTADEVAQARAAKKVERKPSTASTGPANLNKGAPVQMSRREREEKEKAAARERYQALHAAGKTDEAKKDLARLAAIRKQREAQKAAKDKEAADKEAARTAALAKSGRKIAK
ncbi:hypothetical protein JCM10212_002914 [Sporobolomyces blumeae]